jgi:SAM-dependent methyltransferase
MDRIADDGARFETSTGHAMSSVTFLDSRFEARCPEIESNLRSAGIQPGWHVLDAGTGTGNFVPWLVDLVGTTGAVSALDLAPENIAVVERRIEEQHFPCSVSAQVGDILTLPYPDDAFDAVWCAATAEYFSDAELKVALSEFQRVVRSGGLIAIQSADLTVNHEHPVDPATMRRLREKEIAAGKQWAPDHGMIRSTVMRRWFERVGLTDVWQRIVLINRWAPMRAVDRQYVASIWTFQASRAEDVGYPEGDQQFWEIAKDPDSPKHPINHPEYYWREGHTMAVGRV